MYIEEILQKEDVVFIDVREKYEFDSGHIEGAINYPLSSFMQYVDKIKTMDGPIILYCRSGGRSGQAVQLLQNLGMQSVSNGGGIEDLSRAIQLANMKV